MRLYYKASDPGPRSLSLGGYNTNDQLHLVKLSKNLEHELFSLSLPLFHKPFCSIVASLFEKGECLWRVSLKWHYINALYKCAIKMRYINSQLQLLLMQQDSKTVGNEKRRMQFLWQPYLLDPHWTQGWPPVALFGPSVGAVIVFVWDICTAHQWARTETSVSEELLWCVYEVTQTE